MRRLSFAIACLATAASHAQSPDPPPAVKARCATCHGEKGETVGEDFPRLAGQHESYLEKQLRDFQSGARRAS
jgi:cytochrome c553